MEPYLNLTENFDDIAGRRDKAYMGNSITKIKSVDKVWAQF